MIKLIWRLLLKIIQLLIFLLIILAISIFLYQKGWLKNHPLEAQIKRFQDGKINSWQDIVNSLQKEEELNLQLNELSSNAGEQIKATAQKAIEAGKVAQEFVAESIQTDELSEKNLGEKAFEYGQYVYCKAVVDDWEQRTEESKTNEESSLEETKKN